MGFLAVPSLENTRTRFSAVQFIVNYSNRGPFPCSASRKSGRALLPASLRFDDPESGQRDKD